MNISEDHQILDVSLIISKVLKRWYLFVGILPVFFVAAIIFLRYQTSLYQVSASLRVGAESNDGADALLNELTPFQTPRYDILDEIVLINSYQLSLAAVNKKDFKLAYYSYGDVKRTRLYKNAPFVVYFDGEQGALSAGVRFDVKVLSSTSYLLTAYLKGKAIYQFNSDSLLGIGAQDINKEFSFGEYVPLLENYGFRIKSLSDHLLPNESIGYDFAFFTKDELVYQLKGGLKVAAAFDKSSIMNLSMKHATPAIAIDYLNALVAGYREADYQHKLSSITKSLAFLNKQIAETEAALNDKELLAQKLKDDSKIYDLDAAAGYTYEQILVLQEQKEQYLLQQKYYGLVVDYVENHRDMSQLVAPSLMGIDDPMVAAIVSNLSEIYVEKARQDFSITEANPTSTTLDLGQQKAIELALENLNQGIQRISFNLVSIEKQMDDKFALLKTLPSAELSFLRVKREIEGLGKLLEFLVEREAILGISASKVASNHQVINSARLVSPLPIAPKRSLVKLVFFILGIILVGAIIYLLDFLNQKVNSFADVLPHVYGEAALGEVNLVKENSQVFAFTKPASLLVENFRHLKHNLSFVLPNHEGCKVVGMTSITSGEGKTFVAANLAGVLALGNKRVVVIGADLRKPRLNDYFGLPSVLGLSEFLIGNARLDEVIQASENKFLDVLLSGETPPNPAELIESPAFKELLTTLKTRYDYIFLDCSPVGLVADYKSLESELDTTLFIVREGVTSIAGLGDSKELQAKGTHVVMNGIKKSVLDRYSYGKGYYENLT
jgi:tyrosine-protein kinase Etk/Wzc